MANFTAGVAASIECSDGVVLGKSTVNGEFNAKVLFDDVVTGVVDLAPYFAGIAVPKEVLLVASGDGCTINLDGLGASSKAYTEVKFGIAPAPAGVFDLEIEAQGDPQRVRVLVLGDPT